MSTETCDKLYLEYANLTSARNAREVSTRQIAKAIVAEAENLHDINHASRRTIISHARAILEYLK